MEPAGKVVRLPRDWLGPRDELVPFGRRSATREAELGGPALTSEAPPLVADSPPSAADFWGERSAAIHDAVQAPSEDPLAAVTEPGSGATVVARRRGPRPLIAAVVLAIVAIAAAFIASGDFGLGASRSRTAGGPRLNIAAVLSGGVSRTLHSGLALLNVSAGHHRPARAAAQHRARTSRRTAHAHAVFKPAHESTHSYSTTTGQSTSAYVPAYVPTITATRSETSSPPTPPAPSHPSHSSRATVSPTGESGALGPIQSPNG